MAMIIKALQKVLFQRQCIDRDSRTLPHLYNGINYVRRGSLRSVIAG
jgi:hypothetical protein